MKDNSKDKQDDLSALKLHLTKEGSLGILAYGDLAIKAWRKIKKA